MILWVVCRINEKPEEHNDHTWDLIGVCSTEDLAVQACGDDNYFIGPMELNEILPKESVPWPGSYYPTKETEPLEE